MVSLFPVDALPVVPRQELGLLNAVARWLAISRHATRGYPRLEKLAGGPVVIRDVAIGRCDDPWKPPTGDDVHAGVCAVRLGGELIDVRGGHNAVRHISQRILGGPPELPAPRPLGMVEQAMWALAVAAAVEDLGIDCEVVACEAPAVVREGRNVVVTVDLAGTSATVSVNLPRALELRAPPTPVRRWPAEAMVDVAVVIGRCALEISALRALAVRSLITLEPAAAGLPPTATGRIGAELVVLGGAIGIAGGVGALVVEVTTGYVPRAMALPDDAHVELTVGLGTTQLSLRQVFELAIGQVVPLGRPLAGPFEIRAAGKRVGSGELVSIDGELGVRIVSLEE